MNIALDKAKLNRVIDLLSDIEREHVISVYHEFVPHGKFSTVEKLQFIIAAIPLSGRFPAEFIKAQLVTGPLMVNHPLSPYTKPNLIHAWGSKYPEHMNQVANFYSPHKHVPQFIKDNVEWLCIVALAEVIDWANSHGEFPQRPTAEDIDRLFTEWQNFMTVYWR